MVRFKGLVPPLMVRVLAPLIPPGTLMLPALPPMDEALPKVVAEVGRWMGRARAMARQFREQLEVEAAESQRPPPPAPSPTPVHTPTPAPTPTPTSTDDTVRPNTPDDPRP